MKKTILTLAVTSSLIVISAFAQTPTTAFQYQGHVNDGGAPANGSYDFLFSVWTNSTGPAQVGSTFAAPATAVNNGLFTATPDFGAGVFTGPDRWLEIAVRPAGSGSYTTFTPRQKFTSSPYAIYAGNVNAGGLVGTVGDAQLSPNVALRAGGNIFTNTQTFNGAINLNSGGGFDQSSVGNFFIDAPFKPGGRLAVLENGNVGIGVANPAQKLYVNGASIVNGQLTVGFGSIQTGIVVHANSTAIYADNPSDTGWAGYFNGNLGASGPFTSWGPYLVVHGPNEEVAYLGGDGLGTAVRVGSYSPSVTNLQCYNAVSGYMNLSCKTITITGGADLAEPFEISDSSNELSEGSVVVIDEQNPGRLKLSDRPYDTRVAGVLSGANGVSPGIQLRQQGILDHGKNVALTGRVFVRVDASNGLIKPGDLLTTSVTRGNAMKVTDHARAQGAILGKAITGLNEKNGMVLVLVTLQ